MAGVLLGSCHEKDGPEESISVNPETIEASPELASCKLAVAANCAWTVKVEGESGEDAFWLVPSQVSGHGNASLTIRVSENNYAGVRTATLVFSAPGGKQARAVVSQSGSGAQGELQLCLGSYNLRMHNLDTDADNKWDVRKERLKESIKDCGFDVFGVQEVSTDMQTWLDKEFKDVYTFRYFSPYSQGGSGSRAHGIGFKKSMFVMSDWHFFWASDTPDVMSTNDTGSSGSYSRGGCCCVLTHKQSGQKIFFMCTHACLNSEPNAAYAGVYIDQEKRYNPNALPSFFVGDMNARPEYPATATFKTYWKDSYDTAGKKSGASGSFNGYSSVSGKYRIDYVYHWGSGISVTDLTISNKLYGGKYASDHFPVIVNCKISK